MSEHATVADSTVEDRDRWGSRSQLAISLQGSNADASPCSCPAVSYADPTQNSVMPEEKPRRPIGPVPFDKSSDPPSQIPSSSRDIVNQRLQRETELHTNGRPELGPIHTGRSDINNLLPPRRELPFANSSRKPQSAKRFTEAAAKPPKMQPLLNRAQTSLNLQPDARLSFLVQKHDRPKSLSVEVKTSLPGTSDDDSCNKRILIEQGGHAQSIPSRGGLVTQPSDARHPSDGFPGSSSRDGRLAEDRRNSVEIPSSRAGVRSNDTSAINPEGDNGITGILISASNLAEYRKRPSADRLAALETWICYQLEDNNFVTLCEDMEGCWRRIAYGH